MSQPSIFTKIINHEVPSTIQYEDEEFIAFNDIYPQAPVHVLIVPKKQYATLEEISMDDTTFHSNLLLTARKVAKKLGISENYKILMNVGPKMQLVPHLHVHLMGGWENPTP